MPIDAKIEATAHLTRAVRGLEVALDKLLEAYHTADFSDQGDILELITELGERLDVNRIFVAHLKATETIVKKPSKDAYRKLDAALAKLQKLDLETDSLSKVLKIANALIRSVGNTREEVSSRTT